jgi:hypothetical protein
MLVARIMFVSGLSLIVLGIVLAIVVSPLLGLVALVGVVDLVLARMFSSGRFGGETDGGETGAEPSVNPYARED